MRRFLSAFFALVMSFSLAFAEELSPANMKNYKRVLQYATDAQPMALALGESPFTIEQIYNISCALPSGCDFTWQIKLGKLVITSEDTVVDLDQTTSQVTAANIRQLLALLPDVREIDAFNHRNLKNNDMTAIVDEFPDVRIGWSIHLKGVPPIRSDATAFSTFKDNRENQLSSKDVEVLRYVPGLKAIDLGHNNLTDLSFLLNFPDLNILIIADNHVSDLSPLHELKNLEYLEIFRNDFTDLSPLIGLDNLKDLNVCGNKITDLSPVEELKGLERFWCVNTPVSEESMAHFEAARPDVQALWESERGRGYYTSDGWRTHWRYKQYVKMFKDMTWAPFEEPIEVN